MRCGVVAVLALGSVGLVAPGASAAEERPNFPEYQRPAAPTRKFAAERATIELREALPKGEPTIFAPPLKKGQFGKSGEEGLKTPVTIWKDELSTVLDRRLGRSLGGGAGELVFDVKIVDAKGRLDRDLVTEVTLDVRVRRPGGPSLVATRGVSRLSGHLGGKHPATYRLLLAAILDAFERAVLRDEFVIATNEALVARPADDRASEPSTPGERIVPGVQRASRVERHTVTGASHVAAVTFDAGSAYAIGLRYLHDHHTSGHGLAWGGYGAEVRGLTSGDSFGGAGLLVLRGGTGLSLGGLSLEAACGVAGGERAQGMVLFGLYWSFYYVDLGLSVQIPFAPVERPEWMADGSFGVRINVPLYKHETNVERNSPLPAGDVKKFLPAVRTADDTDDED